MNRVFQLDKPPYRIKVSLHKNASPVSRYRWLTPAQADIYWRGINLGEGFRATLLDQTVTAAAKKAG